MRANAFNKKTKDGIYFNIIWTPKARATNLGVLTNQRQPVPTVRISKISLVHGDFLREK